MGDAPYQDIATMCITTIRHHHPAAVIVQLTDAEAPQFPGAEWVWRCEGTPQQPWYTLDFMRVLGMMDDTPTAVVGGDTLICAAMGDVWDEDFDMALTWRREVPDMPYNLGISFCRRPEFFAAVYRRMSSDGNLRNWMGDQKAVAKEVAEGDWKIRTLLCAEWNNSNMAERKIPRARMLHYKGHRKQWMEQHFRAGVWR